MTGNSISGDGGSASLLYIPASRAELDRWNFKDYKDENGNVTYSADYQRDDFWAYIEQDDYLKDCKGGYTERGGAIAPWHHQLDFKFNQDFYIKAGKYRNTLQLGVDVMNVLNLINSKWGVYKLINRTDLLKCTLDKDGKASYQYQKDGDNFLRSTSSRFIDMTSTYRIQFSLRYIFN
jgi:hypothetical protein